MARPRPLSRRSALGALGAGTAATAWGGGTAHAAAPGEHTGPEAAAGAGGEQAVRVLLNGAPAAVGTYAFPDPVHTLTLDNGLVTYTFGRDDDAGGVVTGWPDVSITATSVCVDGVELAHHLNGVDPRDPDRQHSFYIDAAGGKSRLVCDRIDVVRLEHGLAEVVFVDSTSTPLRHEHHLIIRAGRRGLYGYDILTAVEATTINEMRMNTRWDRSILDHCFNWERGKGQQPTYAYLATQLRLQDETWQVDGVDNPDLPSPDSNAGGLSAGDVYTKYDWSLYHYENPMFGHYGHGFGAWFTPLSGVSDQTLAGFYGVGPQRQDLAIHQDALVLNYFGVNHYGLPAYPLPAGYRRLYGPWLSYLTVGDPGDPDAMIADAADIAREEITGNRAGASWVSDPLYPAPPERSTVTGRVRIADGRPAGNMWVLLSTQDVDDVYTIHEPVHFVRTDADGSFALPGVPPAWQPGTTTDGAYVLYVFAAEGSFTGQYKQTGVTVQGTHHHLGTVTVTPEPRTTFLWQIGHADRTGGEYALATKSPARPQPRGYEKTTLVPGDLTFTIGRDWEPEDWYFAQVNSGAWTIRFTLDSPPTGTACLTVSSSMQQGTPPTVMVNGTAAGITGTLPAANDSSIARQADRSGYPRRAALTFPAALLTAGENTLTFSLGGPAANAATPSLTGFGWDTVVLEADEPSPPPPARLTGRVTALGGSGGTSRWQVEIVNHGRGTAHDVRLDAVRRPGAGHRVSDEVSTVPGAGTAAGFATVGGRDPNAFPVPVAAVIPPGGSARATVEISADRSAGAPGGAIEIGFLSDGGHVRGTATGAV